MPELVVMEGKCQPIQLEPFVHQVGGQSSILKFDDMTICKPLISREHHFYEAMPPELKEFTPQYRGVIEVTFHEDSDGFMTLAALPPKCKVQSGVGMADSPGSSPSSSGEGAQSDSDSESLPIPRTRQRFRMRQSGTIEMHGEEDTTFEVQDPKLSKEDPSTASLNPWSLRCHREQLAKMRSSGKGNGIHKFILLENLASHFRMPCILDLKMGTRQHGDDAGEEKRKRQEKKCQKTTSHSLGLRLCGMQVYQSDTGHYMCHNKYFGRKLSAEGVQDTLLEFLNNGTRIRTGLIDSIIERLRKLHEVLSQQNTFRFYSSSLLIMYDGWEVENADSPSQSQAQQQRQRDTFFEQQQQQHKQQQQGEAASSAGQNSNSIGASLPAGTTHDANQSDNAMHWEANQFESQSQQKVDVRMIDFAHTTHEGFRGDRTLHAGPDKGYLFGLESLIRMFEKLKATVYS